MSHSTEEKPGLVGAKRESIANRITDPGLEKST